jgi:integration host factor subunit beta
MTEALLRGETVTIRGFGAFTVRHYRAYQGRNPRNGVPVQVKAKRLPYFRVGDKLRARVNADGRNRSPPS